MVKSRERQTETVEECLCYCARDRDFKEISDQFEMRSDPTGHLFTHILPDMLVVATRSGPAAWLSNPSFQALAIVTLHLSGSMNSPTLLTFFSRTELV